MSIPSFAQSEDNSVEDLLKYYDKQIYFTENKGQLTEHALFKAEFPYGQAVVTKSGMVISTYDPASVSEREEEGERIEQDIKEGKAWKPFSTSLKGHAWKMNFLNSSPEMKIVAKEQHSDKFNYFKGSNTITDVNNFGEIWYTDVYKQIDVRYYPSIEGTLEYDIICKPGFDNKNLRIQFDGIEQMEVLENGHLELHTSAGDVDFPEPIVYQKINSVEKAVTARYILEGNILAFELGEFDKQYPLIIDPIALRWATWVNTNSSGDNHGHCIWVDPSDGAIYMVARVVGTTDQITPGAFNTAANGNLDMIIGRYLEPAAVGGSGIRDWQTYVGGSGDDNPYAMEQGPEGDIYITGYTASSNFPLLGGPAYAGGGASIDQRAQTTDNIFVMKINTAGNSIKSSVIGGGGDDGGFDLRTSQEGDVIVCGNHNSNNLGTLYPGTGSLDRANSNNGQDVIVFQINADLSSIAWMKNYGGSSTDQATIMVKNKINGDLYIGGYTSSSNFPTLNPRQSTLGGSRSGFIQKLKTNGTTVWSSYFQSANNAATSILCMEFNTTKSQLYFGGITSGLAAANIAGGLYTGYNGGTNDLFVCRMDTNQNFVNSTYLGGTANEVNMMGLNTDLNNDVYIFGYTNSTNFPISAFPNTPLQTSNLGSNDKTFTKINSTLSTLVFSTYYGGAGDDYDPVGERGIKFSNCRIYTIVTSKSNNIPLTQGTINPARISTTPYEPGLVVWANPPDLLDNTITGNQTICAGVVPSDLTGSAPNYVLPTISRNNTTSVYPNLGSATTYQWQISIDSTNWIDIPGVAAEGQNLPGSVIGPLYAKTFFRRVIGGDACILAGAADQVITVRIVSATADVTNATCNGTDDGSITANSDGVPPLSYVWSHGPTTQIIDNLVPGSYTVTVTDNGNCTATNTFTVTEPDPVNANAGLDHEFVCAASSTVLHGTSSTVGAAFSWSSTDGNIVSGGGTADVTINAVGTYVLTVTNTNNNCTATDTVLVTLSTANTSSTDDVIICQGESYTPPGGTAQTTTGQYVTVIPNTQGCDSTITTNLTVNDSYDITGTPVVECDMYTLPWGQLVNSSGDYDHLYSSVNSCDSLVTIHVTIKQGYKGTGTPVSGCDSYTLPWSTVATSTGNYTHTYQSLNGCDSVVTIHVTINPGYNETGDPVTSCDSYELPWGQMANSTGNYSHTYASLELCDSTVTIHVTINNSYNETGDPVVECDTYQLPWGDNATSTGDYSFTYTSILDCDSTVTIHVTINSSYNETGDPISGCVSYTLPWSDVASATGDYSHTYTSVEGCDSTVSIHVTINSGYNETGDPVTACVSYTLPWSDVAGATGDYSHTYTSAEGCDSTVTIHVTINTSFNETGDPVSACVSYTLPWSDVASATGDYSHTYTSEEGCDSTVSIHVTINSSYNETGDPVNTCGTYTLPWGDIINSTGNYMHTYSSEQGCDSTITIHVNINPGYQTIGDPVSACGSHTLPWGQMVSSNGTYSHTYTSVDGCDSTVSIAVTITTAQSCRILVRGCGPNNTVCPGQTIELCAAAGQGYTYLWSTTATTQCIDVTAPGTYTVTVTYGVNCSSTCSITINPGQGPSCSISVSGCGNNNTLCQGQTAQLCAPSGSGYSYSWNTGSTSRCITINGPGNYMVTVTKSSGCSSSCNVIISPGQGPNCNISVSGCGNNNTLCQGQTAQLCAPSGSGYTYLWSNGSHSRCISVNGPGTYSVTVKKGTGCTSTCSVTLNPAPSPVSDITVNGSNLCQGQALQLCVPNVQGNTYSWNTGSRSNCITINGPGTYTVTVKNSAGCTSTSSKTITSLGSPNSSITISGCGPNNSLCQGQTAQLCVASGQGYSYSWNTGASSRCINVTTSGTYTVTVTNSAGCSSTSSKTITVNGGPSCTISGNTLISNGQWTSLCAPSGSGYSYTWSNGSRNRCITVNCPGTYSVTVRNQNGCSSTCSVTVRRRNIQCRMVNNVDDGSITAIPEEGVAPYSFSWNTFPVQTTATAQIKSTGNYTVTVTDADGNKISASSRIEIPSMKVVVRPNPFTRYTTLSVSTFNEDQTSKVEIFSLEGVKVATLYNGILKAGSTTDFKWDASQFKTGVYIYRISVGEAVETGRLVLEKDTE